ncbi:MAG TPA: hypothetical protein VGH44_01065 [Candidatus Saccharimonadia bacterium]|jgi:hypothetical protein
MNIELSPEEYAKLLELIYLGEWVINAHHDTEFQDEAASIVIQRVLAAAPPGTISKDEETGEYYLDSEWVEGVYDKYILDYDDHVFWDELTERLAQRDLARQRGVGADEINRDDDLLELRPIEERYREELEENGIDRLEISSEY